MRVSKWHALFVAAFICARAAEAQLAPGLTITPGAEVRVTLLTPPARVRGLLVVVTPDSIRLQARGGGAASTFRFDNVRRVEVRGGEDKRRGFLIGGAILGGIAVVFGGLDLARGEITRDDYAGAIIGNFLIGGLVGYVFAPKGWVDIPLLR